MSARTVAHLALAAGPGEAGWTEAMVTAIWALRPRASPPRAIAAGGAR